LFQSPFFFDGIPFLEVGCRFHPFHPIEPLSLFSSPPTSCDLHFDTLAPSRPQNLFFGQLLHPGLVVRFFHFFLVFGRLGLAGIRFPGGTFFLRTQKPIPNKVLFLLCWNPWPYKIYSKRLFFSLLCDPFYPSLYQVCAGPLG